MIWCYSLIALIIGASEPEEALSRIRAHLILQDPYPALQELKLECSKYPASIELKKMQILCLARCGHCHEALQVWRALGDPTDLELIEEIAWGILTAAEQSAQLPIAASSLIGHCLTRDARAVSALIHSLNSTNAQLRLMSVRFGSNYGDAVLIDALQTLLDTEKVWPVRLEIIHTLGRLKVKGAKDQLEALLEQSTDTEEQAACIGALARLLDDVSDPHIEQLLTSKNAGLRMLGLELVLQFDKRYLMPVCLPLIKDPNVAVRCAALSMLGLLGGQVDGIGVALDELLQEDLCPVNVHAAWLALFSDKKKGLFHLYRLATHAQEEVRWLAAAAIGHSGERGELLGAKLLRESQDPFVRANLALHLIGSEAAAEETRRALMHFLEEDTTKLMFKTWGGSHFPVLCPSILRHNPQVAEYPALIDQQVHLVLYHILLVLRVPEAEQKLQQFFEHPSAELVQAAAAALVQEGSEEALEALKRWMHSDTVSESLKLGAALVLAYAGEEEALDKLEQLYPKLGKEEKLMVIEAIGHIKGKGGVQFLLGVLDESAHILRIAAASSIIQSLRN